MSKSQDQIASEKTDLRRRMRAVRAALSETERERGAAAIATWSPVVPRQCVSAYVAIGDEFDPGALLVSLARERHSVCLPVMVGKSQPLVFRAYEPGDPLATVQWGIREPLADKPIREPDVLLIPLLAIDLRGYRLGYGGGYYDRTLRHLRSAKRVLAIGVGFDVQVIDAVPRVHYDEPLDAVLTPSGYRAFPL